MSTPTTSIGSAAFIPNKKSYRATNDDIMMVVCRNRSVRPGDRNCDGRLHVIPPTVMDFVEGTSLGRSLFSFMTDRKRDMGSTWFNNMHFEWTRPGRTLSRVRSNLFQMLQCFDDLGTVLASFSHDIIR